MSLTAAVKAIREDHVEVIKNLPEDDLQRILRATDEDGRSPEST